MQTEYVKSQRVTDTKIKHNDHSRSVRRSSDNGGERAGASDGHNIASKWQQRAWRPALKVIGTRVPQVPAAHASRIPTAGSPASGSGDDDVADNRDDTTFGPLQDGLQVFYEH